MPIEIVRDVEKRCQGGKLKGWETDLKEKNKYTCHELGEAIAGMVENKRKNQTDIKPFIVTYREKSDFIISTLKWKSLEPGVRGLFGKLNKQSAPRNYDGTEYLCVAEFEPTLWEEADAEEYLKVSNFNKEMEVVKDVVGMEVFKPGKWNGDEYLVKDLEEMVKNFKDGVWSPYLKLGHNNTQNAVKQFLDGMPRFGTAKDVYIKDDKLYVDWVNVPAKLANIILSAYPKKSCEIFTGFKKGEKIFNYVLGAVALLGDNIPAVDDLNDIFDLYEPQPALAFKDVRVYEEENYSKENKDSGGGESELSKRGEELYAKHTKAWHRCVERVSARGDVDSPEAVCTWSLGRTGDVYMKKDGKEPDVKKLARVNISLGELQMISPDFAKEVEKQGYIGVVINCDNDYDIEFLKKEEDKQMADKTKEEIAVVEEVKTLKAEVDKTKAELEATKKQYSDAQANLSKLQAEAEKVANKSLVAEVTELIKSKLSPEAGEHYITLKKAIAGLSVEVKAFSIKDGDLVEGKPVNLMEIFTKFVGSIPAKDSLKTKENETTKGDGKDTKINKIDDSVTDENAELDNKVTAYLKEKNLVDSHHNRRFAYRQIMIEEQAKAKK